MTLLTRDGEHRRRFGKYAGREHEVQPRARGVAHATVRIMGPRRGGPPVMHRTNRVFVAGPAARAFSGRAFAVQARAERVGHRDAQKSGLAPQCENSQHGHARAKRTHLVRVVQVRKHFKHGSEDVGPLRAAATVGSAHYHGGGA